MLTILLTSGRVAPGLLSWAAWDALRSATRVLVGSADHPQVPALAEAGIVAEVVALPDSAAGLAALLAEAVRCGDPRGVAWLPPTGADADPGLLAALDRLPVPGGVRVLAGPADLPGAHLLDVVATMDTLRVSCPWDRKQTHASLAPSLLEEAYEVLDALDSPDPQALREELGDVLLNVVFQARIAAERVRDDAPGADDGSAYDNSGYDIDDVADTLVAKLVRRHPHVFAGVAVTGADDVIRNWDEIKKAERAAKPGASAGDPPSVLDGVAFGQPALSLAAQVLRRAARAGFPLGELPAATPGSIGEEILRIVARAVTTGADPELELRSVARELASFVREWELQQP